MIKSQIYFLTVFLFSFSLYSNAQNIENKGIDSALIEKYKHTKPISLIIKTNLIPVVYSKLPLSSEYRLIGEFSITQKQSICIGGSYIGKTFLYNLLTPPKGFGQALYIKGYRIQLGYKYYLVQKKLRPSGLYLSPHLSYYAANYAYVPFGPNVDFDRITNITADLLLGLQIIKGNIATFDFFSGLGYNKYTYTQYSFVYNTKRVVHKNPDDFGGLINTSPLRFIPIGFNFGLAF